jgi:histidinol phosphatase-like enzyme (inositol monophosphatase family)
MAFEREVELAKLIVQEAGALALDYQRRGVTAESKSDESPVTAADRACEKLIVETLAREFPADGVLGEEGANRESQNGRRWIVDPIDGTRDFVRGIPLWAVLLGLEEDGEIIAAAAFSPGQKYLLWAGKGAGAWCNGGRVHVSSASQPAQSVLSFNGFHKSAVRHYAAGLVDLLQGFWAVRSLGGAIDAMLVAQGLADAWIEPSAAPWDLAPFKLLIEEAGGVFKSFAGEKTIYGGNCFACAPGLESHLRDFLYSEK